MDLLLTVRGLAAVAVVVWHAEGYLGRLPALINVPGRTAVWLFFGISGYVIAHGFVHRRYSFTLSDLKWFYANRFLRIYPLFLVLSGLSLITEFLAAGRSPISWSDVPAQLFAFQFDQEYVLNGVFWTLGIELHFYLIAPLLLAPLLIKNTSRSCLLALGLYALMVLWNRYAVARLGWSYDGRNVVANLPHFFAGMIACRFVASSKLGPAWASVALTTACILLAYTSWLYHHHSGQFWSTRGILLVDLIIVSLIVAHAGWESRRPKPYSMYTALAFLGTVSYGIYAWHSYLMKYVPYMAGHTLVLIVSSVLTAYASYRLVESPALRLKRYRPSRALCGAN